MSRTATRVILIALLGAALPYIAELYRDRTVDGGTWFTNGGLRLAGFHKATENPKPVPWIAADTRKTIVENDPLNPKGMQIRRARRAGESWPEYFREVYLWPYDAEHFNHIFATLNQDGRKVQFIANTVFAVDRNCYLVLRGDRPTIELMAKNVLLEKGNGSIPLVPNETRVLKSLIDDTWLGFVRFPRPDRSLKQIMSSFALYGRAGGVAEVLDEEAARRKFSVPRDVVEIIQQSH